MQLLSAINFHLLEFLGRSANLLYFLQQFCSLVVQYCPDLTTAFGTDPKKIGYLAQSKAQFLQATDEKQPFDHLVRVKAAPASFWRLFDQPEPLVKTDGFNIDANLARNSADCRLISGHDALSPGYSVDIKKTILS